MAEKTFIIAYFNIFSQNTFFFYQPNGDLYSLLAWENFRLTTELGRSRLIRDRLIKPPLLMSSECKCASLILNRKVVGFSDGHFDAYFNLASRHFEFWSLGDASSDLVVAFAVHRRTEVLKNESISTRACSWEK